MPRLEHVAESEKVNLTEDGKKALITLSNGDMRWVVETEINQNLNFKINFETLLTKTQPKRKTVCGVSSLSENVNIVNLKSEPQRETQTQQRAWFSWHGVARGAVRDSHTRRRHGTRAVR